MSESTEILGKNMKTKTFDEAVVRYGPIISGKWPGEPNWMEVVHMPDWFIAQVKGLDGNPCKRIYMNKDMVKPFLDALDRLVTTGRSVELKTFDGCWNIRLVRGSKDAQSAHSYGLAVDLNAPENPLGGPVAFSKEFIQCFIDAGFDAGANFGRVDGQHFSYAWEHK